MYARQEKWSEAAALLKQGKRQEALREYEAALKLEPTLTTAHVAADWILASENRLEEGIRHLEAGVRAAPDGVEGLAAPAWVRATEPDAKYRNGAEAVGLAEHAAGLTGRRDARVLSILAAAYAESGRFGEAVATAEQAERLCAAAGQMEQASAIVRKLELYRRGEPYHRNQTSRPAGPG